MSQAQLSELAKRVLGVDERGFRKLVRELARRAPLVPYYLRWGQLGFTDIVLGHARPDERGYMAVVDVPLCREVR